MRKYPAGGPSAETSPEEGWPRTVSDTRPTPITIRCPGQRKRRDGATPIVMVTAYDEPGARIVSDAGADIVLVGDSVANNVLGYEDTLHVDIDVMAHHVAAVARAKPHSLILGDLPWMSYHLSTDDAVRNAATLIRAGAQAVKLEGGRARLPVVEAIIRAEIPVMGHLGLTPQSMLAMGGFRVQAKSVDAASALLDAAKSLEAAGCFAFVIEGVPDVVGAAVTEALDVPTIGIGAGPCRTARSWSSTTCWVWARARRPSSCASMPSWAGSPPRPWPPSPRTCAGATSPVTRRRYHGSAELGDALS